MTISKRRFLGVAGAAIIVSSARAADKVVGGSLGGQAPLWPFYIALHKGFFAAQGIDLELNLAQSGAAITQQLTAGSLNIVLSVGVSDPIHAIDKGASLAIVRIVGNTPPYVLIGKAGLKSIADLKGKIVSVGTAGDPTTLYFERMAAANGLKKGEYDTLSAGVAAARYAALKAGVVDAAMVLPPLNFRAMKAGFVTLGLAADYVKDLPFTGMAVYTPWASNHVAAVKRVMAATDRSIAWLADPAHRKEAVELLVEKAHANADDAEASYDLLRRIHYFEPTSTVSRAKLQNLIDVERRAGSVSPALTVDRLVMPGVTQLIG
jgi:ABC-type nitrate/sulfonate/bicarbonate transport system substrate-binding protein